MERGLSLRTPLNVKNTKVLLSSGRAKLEKKDSETDYRLQVLDLSHKRTAIETPGDHKPRRRSDRECKSESEYEQNIDQDATPKALNQITVSVHE